MVLTIKTNDPFAAARKNAIPGAKYVYVKPKTENKEDITGTNLVSKGTPLPPTPSGRQTSSYRTSNGGRMPTQAEAEEMTLLAKPQEQPKWKPQTIKPPNTRGGTISRQGEPPYAPRQQYQGEIRRTDVSEQARQGRFRGYAEMQAAEEERLSGPETMGGFFFDEPKSRGYYETRYGPAAGFMEFGRTSAVTAQRSMNPLEWKPGSGFGNVDITNKGFNNAYSNIAHNPFSFTGQAAGIGFAFMAPGKVGMGKLAGMFGKQKSFKVTYLKGMAEMETKTALRTSGKGDLTFLAAKEGKATSYIKTWDTKSLNSMMKNGYPSDISKDIYGNVFKEAKGPGIKNYVYEFGYGPGKSTGSMKRMAFLTETKIEKAKPKVPSLIDTAVMEKSSFIGGKFEGVIFRQARTGRVSFPVSFEEDTFKVTRYKGKPSGKLPDFMDTSSDVKPDFYTGLVTGRDFGNFNFPRRGGVIGPELERPAKMPLSFAWKAPISAEKIGGFDFDFFPTPGRSRPDLSTGGLNMKTLSVFTPTESRRQGTNLGIDILGKQQGSLKMPSFLYKGRSREKSGLNVKDILNTGSMLNIGSASRSNQRQNVFNLQKQQQKQRQEQRTGFRFPNMRSPKLGGFLGPSRGRGNPFAMGKGGFSLSLGGKGHGRVFTKAFYSDLLSVNYSVGKFGKVTHPALTKANWGKAEKSMFLNVPTVEMMGLGGRKKKKR
jgi:hypothetical protein